MAEIVWEFTNQKKLTKKEFVNYFEKKIFRTIRKYGLLPEDRIFRIKKADDINTNVLVSVLKNKFNVEYSNIPNINSDNLSDIAEKTFENILAGKFKKIYEKNDEIGIPLYYNSDKELKLYSELKQIVGTAKKRNEKIQNLFSKFIDKNQDLEINVIKAMSQLPQ